MVQLLDFICFHSYISSHIKTEYVVFLLGVMDVLFGFHPPTWMMVLVSSIVGVLVTANLLLLAASVYIMLVRRKYSHLPTPPVPRYTISACSIGVLYNLYFNLYQHLYTCRENGGWRKCEWTKETVMEKENEWMGTRKADRDREKERDWERETQIEMNRELKERQTDRQRQREGERGERCNWFVS